MRPSRNNLIDGKIVEADLDLMGVLLAWEQRHRLTPAQLLYLLCKYLEQITRRLVNQEAKDDAKVALGDQE